jgi:hypothetical protein
VKNSVSGDSTVFAGYQIPNCDIPVLCIIFQGLCKIFHTVQIDRRCGYRASPVATRPLHRLGLRPSSPPADGAARQGACLTGSLTRCLTPKSPRRDEFRREIQPRFAPHLQGWYPQAEKTLSSCAGSTGERAVARLTAGRGQPEQYRMLGGRSHRRALWQQRYRGLYRPMRSIVVFVGSSTGPPSSKKNTQEHFAHVVAMF